MTVLHSDTIICAEECFLSHLHISKVIGIFIKSSQRFFGTRFFGDLKFTIFDYVFINCGIVFPSQTFKHRLDSSVKTTISEGKIVEISSA